MNQLLVILKKVFNPKWIFFRIVVVIGRKCPYFVSDKLFLEACYYVGMGKDLNLKNPKTFNEKIQWLKLYNRRPEYTMMVDKLAVKEYVAKKVGAEYVIPILGIWEKPEEIDFDTLPNQFVLKTTHAGGGKGVIVCKDKDALNKKNTVERLNVSLGMDLASFFREWAYKDVPRRILAEKYMVDGNNDCLKDFKFYCFNGIPKLCQVISDREGIEKIDFYDMEWKKIPDLIGLSLNVVHDVNCLPKPLSFEKMKYIAMVLSNNIPFVRVDMYEINGRCYFGEITFYPNAGLGRFRPERWNEIIGSWIKL